MQKLLLMINHKSSKLEMNKVLRKLPQIKQTMYKNLKMSKFIQNQLFIQLMKVKIYIIV